MINLDPHVVLPAARNIELVGGGRTELELRLAAAAAKLGLRVDAEPNPEAGWYFRSDHFPFASRGVPAIAFRAGRDLVEGGTAAGNAIVGPYNARATTRRATSSIRTGPSRAPRRKRASPTSSVARLRTKAAGPAGIRATSTARCAPASEAERAAR